MNITNRLQRGRFLFPTDTPYTNHQTLILLLLNRQRVAHYEQTTKYDH